VFYQCHKLIKVNNHAGGIEAAKAIIDRPPDYEPPLPSSSNITPGWYKREKCHPVRTANRHKCCRQRPCVSLSQSQESLSVAILGRSDIYVDRSNFSNEGTRFAAYCKPPVHCMCFGRMVILAEEIIGWFLHV